MIVVMAGAVGVGTVGASTALAESADLTSAHATAVVAPVTDAYPKGKVISRSRLVIRAKPTTHSKRLGSLRPGQIVDIKCWVNGQPVKGVRKWYRLGISTPEWVSGRYIKIIKGKVSHC
ncbi:SH3 domain-containing protein [Actinomadura graeca]|uniref:SH3 domain-containing protein n=1 Tax=Actinomadura graeca TaxID=2750812 RepID=A0ABX8R272_9ACTN|nr:SH3 domain-containing protein [Actinomadura graeca]QXJ24067.1 SH3 domain-containing protein [Actinomadura graeca]